MSVLIGANTWGKYHRQDVAVDSWLHLADTEVSTLVRNIQFYDDTCTFENPYDIEPVFSLTRSSNSVIPNYPKKLPFVNDIIHSLFIKAVELGCEYFIFTNSDVILKSNLINYINTSKPDSFACSRLDISNIESFQYILDQNVTPIRYEIAGFDTFVFNVNWYEKHQALFRDYLLGKPQWDQVYATLMKVYGGNHPFGNQLPPYCLHIQHEATWQKEVCAGREFNGNSVDVSYLDKLMCKIFDTYLQTHLIHRQPYGSFLKKIPGEREIEQNFFKNYYCK